MEKNPAEVLRYYDFDKSMWKCIRTTNILERASRELSQTHQAEKGVPQC